MLDMPKMREIDLGRTTWRTKEMVAAIAWATNRRGHNSWRVSEETRNRSVSNDILAYLKNHNVRLDEGWTGPRITYVLKQLSQHGFADIRMHVYGVAEFKFHSDVILSGYVPEFKAEGIAKAESANPTVDGQKVVERVKGAINPPNVVDLPLPGIKPPRYRADTLNELLDRFAEADPEGYANYADKLIAALSLYA